MNIIEDGMTKIEKDYEKEFRAVVEEIAYFQGDHERSTLDGEWTESELKDNFISEAEKVINNGWIAKTKFRALKDPDMMKAEFIMNHLLDEEGIDFIELYNKIDVAHRNEDINVRRFNIHYFDDWIKAKVKKILTENLITG